MTVAYDGAIYVLGGADKDWNPTATAWKYEPATNLWGAVAPLPEPRLAGAAVALGDHIYVAGGIGGSSALLRYEPNTNRWISLAPNQIRREHTAAVAFGGKLVLIGGRWRNAGELRSVEIYDVAMDRWRDGPPLTTPRGGHAAVVYDNEIMVFGGEVIGRDRTALADSERLDQLAGHWRPGPPLPKPLHGMAAVSKDAMLFILGGSEQAAAAVNSGKTYAMTASGGKP
jgi:N-acetylneuraminic acid mutarotase